VSGVIRDRAPAFTIALSILAGLLAEALGICVIYVTYRYGDRAADGVSAGVDALGEAESAVRLVGEDFLATTGILGQVSGVLENTIEALGQLEQTLETVREGLGEVSNASRQAAGTVGDISTALSPMVSSGRLQTLSQNITRGADATDAVVAEVDSLSSVLSTTGELLSEVSASVDSFRTAMTGTGESFTRAADRLAGARRVADRAVRSGLVLWAAYAAGGFLLVQGLVLILLGFNLRKRTREPVDRG
jgi:methyl-accepting chemotaxis protein